MRRPTCRCVLCVILGSAVAALILLAGAPAAHAAGKKVSFLKDVAPALKASCFGCHNDKVQRGKYNMATFKKLTEGGAIGGAIIPRDLEGSELVYRLTAKEKDLVMPPPGKGTPLTAEQVTLVKKWVMQGAEPGDRVKPDADLVKLLDSGAKAPLPPAEYAHPVVVNAVTFTPDGKRLVAGGHHELTVWDIEDGKLLRRVHTKAERAYAMCFTPAGELVVAGGRPGRQGDVSVYDIDAGEPADRGGFALIDGVNDPAVKLAELADSDDAFLCLALSAGGKRLAAGGCGRAVRVWDIAGGAAAAKLTQTVAHHADWVMGLAFTGDGKKLFTASRDKTAKVWDLVKKQPSVTFPMHGETVFAVATDNEGEVGVSAGADGRLRAWATAGDGKQVRDTDGRGGEVYKLRRLGDGRLLSASAESKVLLWKADGSKVIREFKGLDDYVFSLAVSPDGKRLAAGAYDGIVAVWDIESGQQLARLGVTPGLGG